MNEPIVRRRSCWRLSARDSLRPLYVTSAHTKYSIEGLFIQANMDKRGEHPTAHLCDALLQQHDAPSEEVCCARNGTETFSRLRQASKSSNMLMYIKCNGELLDANDTVGTLDECLSTLVAIKNRLNDRKALLNNQVDAIRVDV